MKQEKELTPDVLGWGVKDDGRFPSGEFLLLQRQSLPSPKVTPQPKISGVFLLSRLGPHPKQEPQPWLRGTKAARPYAKARVQILNNRSGWLNPQAEGC